MIGWSAVAFVAGAWSLALLPELPSLAWLVLPAALIPPAWRWPWVRPVAAGLTGLGFALWAAHERVEPELAPAVTGETEVRLRGRVASLPQRGERRTRFRFAVEHARLDGEAVQVPDTIRLSWYGADTPTVAPGQRWALTARLDRPRGSLNPGGFDYERWLFREGIGATGYVRAQPAPARLPGATAALARTRGYLRQRLIELTRGLDHAGILLALTVGDRDRISPETWDELIATGTNHLVAISGLHIGLLAAAGFALGAPLWQRVPVLRTHLARPVAQALCALALASLYAALAGFALPTQRALVMLAAGFGALILRRRARPLEALLIAAVSVVVLDPLTPLGPAFWLSFGAVASILYVAAGRLGRPRRITAWVRLQMAIGVTLTPMLVVLFGQASVVAPAVNLIAVPWVSLTVVPPALAGAALAPWWPGGSELVLTFADVAFEPIAVLLEQAAGLDFARWQRATPPWPVTALAVLGSALVLAPRGVPGRAAGVIMLVPLLGWTPPRPPAGAFWLDVLDVGQGLAAVVRTRSHTLVYDTGPRFSERFDAGSAMVVPFLRQAGTDDVDALVVSHGHADHSGGLDSVARAYPPERIWSGEPHTIGANADFCARGQSWRWDGVRFRFLHPQRNDALTGNNASCVLRIEGPGGSVLLPGDIERGVERKLIRRGAELDADVVVAPHHGSASSSSSGFVERVDPRWVLYSVGFGNRWNFPQAAVLRRWRPAGFARTDCGGALHVRLGPQKGVSAPEPFRRNHRRLWHAGCDRPGTSGTMRAVSRPGTASGTGD